MRLINEVMKPFLGKSVMVYLDNILTFGKMTEENLSHFQQVLQRLSHEKLLVNMWKCSFMKKELVYPGLVIFGEGLNMDPKKVNLILEWIEMTNTIEMRSFHRIYYSNAISLDILVEYVHH